MKFDYIVRVLRLKEIELKGYKHILANQESIKEINQAIKILKESEEK